jgi:1,4-dihydroxy-2-naphthoate octaprenyltransferase
MAIAVSLSFLFWKAYDITWLHAIIGLPLLCLAMTGAIYKLLFPAFKRNILTNVIVHLAWTSVVAIATSLIATGDIHWDVLSAIAPIGLIAAGITHGNTKAAAQAYAVEIMTPYVYFAVGSIIGVFPIATIIIFMTIAIALGCSKTMKNSTEDAEHLRKDMGARTANLLHLFAGLLAVAFAVARFI